EVIGYNRSAGPAEAIAKDGMIVAAGLEDMAAKLKAPRIFWVMLPAGEGTENTVEFIASLCSPGDIIIDGGKSFYKDDIRRAKALRAKQLDYVDIGTSGGVWGLERGFCMMVGGEKRAVDHLDPILKTLAPGFGTIPRTSRADGADPRAEFGYIHAGPAG